MTDLNRKFDRPELAAAIQRILDNEGGRSFSLRMAEIKTGLSPTTISKLKSGLPTGMEPIIEFARGFRVAVNPLLVAAGYRPLAASELDEDLLARIGTTVELAGLRQIQLSNIPASAGEQKDVSEGEIETVGSALDDELRAIRVDGDCMLPFFQDRDVLFIRPQSTAESGERVIAFIPATDAIVCKTFRRDASGPYLEATNGVFPRTSDFDVLGVVRYFLRSV